MAENKWRDKYEKIVRALQKEFEDTVIKAQEQAEASSFASQEIITKLKEELGKKEAIISKQKSENTKHKSEISRLRTELEQERKRRRKRGEEDCKEEVEETESVSKKSSSDTEETKEQFHVLRRRISFLQTITCLSVSALNDFAYLCTLDDGELMGHEFKIEYDAQTYEYRYTPVHPAPTLEDDDILLESVVFPDYMVPRFLMKMLKRTYSSDAKQQEEETITLSD